VNRKISIKKIFSFESSAISHELPVHTVPERSRNPWKGFTSRKHDKIQPWNAFPRHSWQGCRVRTSRKHDKMQPWNAFPRHYWPGCRVRLMPLKRRNEFIIAAFTNLMYW